MNERIRRILNQITSLEDELRAALHIGGIEFTPTEYVDVTAVMETKRRMLECHQSQIKPMRELAHADLLEMMEAQSRFRGLAAGCRFAEAFRKLEAFQRGLTQRVLP
jgi:LmbE family N-acetylglucosaminyl deacetylase